MLHIVLYTVQALVIAACFIFSLRLINKKVSPSYMKFFLLYPVLGFLFMIVLSFSLLFNWFSSEVNFIINNISRVFHFFILSTIIYKIQNPRIYSFAQIFIIVAGWVYLILTLYLEGWNTPNLKSQFAANLPLVILALFYFGSLLNNVSIGNLKKDPGFWIIVGVVFGSGFNLPLFATMEQLIQFLGQDFAKLFYDFCFISFSLLYVFFIKAIKCTQII